MKVLVAEDEVFAFESLRRTLKSVVEHVDIDGPIQNIIALHDKLAVNQQEYDLFLCDVKLEDGLCFEAFKGIDLTTPIIFTTAYDSHAIEAIKTGCIDYLLKPIDKDELHNAIEKALEHNRIHLIIPDCHGEIVLNTFEVSHFAKEGDDIAVYTTDGRSLKLSEKSLDNLERQLNHTKFFRANRQYIVSYDSVERTLNDFRQRKIILLRDYPGKEINVSKEKSTQLLRWLER